VQGEIVYAIVRAGGRQEKVAVGDLITLDRVGVKPGDVFTLPTVMIVDGGVINTKASDVVVTAEVIDHTKGKKIEILRYKNKTGYRRRQGHRLGQAALGRHDRQQGIAGRDGEGSDRTGSDAVGDQQRIA